LNRQSPRFIEQASEGNYRLGLKLEHCEVAPARQAVVSPIFGFIYSEAAIQNYIAVRIERIRIDQGWEILTGRKSFGLHDHCLARPTDWKLAADSCDPTIASWIAK
jgi:hypothetical protein